MILRRKNEAPFRCGDCGLRFIAKNEAVDAGSADQHVPLANYLGLTGWARQAFTDQTILGSLLAVALLLLLIAFFALAFGWIDPEVLHLHAAWPPASG